MCKTNQIVAARQLRFEEETKTGINPGQFMIRPACTQNLLVSKVSWVCKRGQRNEVARLSSFCLQNTSSPIIVFFTRSDTWLIQFFFGYWLWSGTCKLSLKGTQTKRTRVCKISKLIFSSSVDFKQGRTHSYLSRVQVGRGHIWGHFIILAEAVRAKTAKKKGVRDWRKD